MKFIIFNIAIALSLAIAFQAGAGFHNTLGKDILGIIGILSILSSVIISFYKKNIKILAVSSVSFCVILALISGATIVNIIPNNDITLLFNEIKPSNLTVNNAFSSGLIIFISALLSLPIALITLFACGFKKDELTKSNKIEKSYFHVLPVVTLVFSLGFFDFGNVLKIDKDSIPVTFHSNTLFKIVTNSPCTNGIRVGYNQVNTNITCYMKDGKEAYATQYGLRLVRSGSIAEDILIKGDSIYLRGNVDDIDINKEIYVAINTLMATTDKMDKLR